MGNLNEKTKKMGNLNVKITKKLKTKLKFRAFDKNETMTEIVSESIDTFLTLDTVLKQEMKDSRLSVKETILEIIADRDNFKIPVLK